MPRSTVTAKRKDQSRDCDELATRLRPLVKQLAAIQTQARALGLFVEDRELLSCRHCGLQEDVAGDGRLMTYRVGGDVTDTRLRFEEVRGGKFRCPSCAHLVTAPTVEEIEKELGDGR